VVAFLAKVYGDAEDEEHIKLARVLQTILHFSPEERATVDEKIEYYEASWWHRTANLLKPAPEVPTKEEQPATSTLTSLWGSVFGSAAG
jgi:hypothetical protein